MIKNLQTIKEKSNIVNIISRFIEVHESGSSAKACCPFHGEKTPSFNISHKKQVYHCFGCGKSGDVFQFVEDMMKVEFVEAVEYVAKEVGERVEYEKGRENFRQEYAAAKDTKDLLIRITDEVHKFYTHNTWGHTPPFSFDRIDIDGRDYKGETIDEFKLCYAPTNVLYKAAKDGRFSIDDLEKAGFISKSDRTGGYYDYFSNRTLFPLFDPSGKVIGFTGRKQPDSPEKSAKYKNSPDSAIFNKSKFLFGLHQNGNTISRMDTAYIVEGQHDLLTMYEAGIKNVVATSGTALTAHHAKLLNRYCDSAVLLFDADEAGLKATIRGVEVLAEVMNVKVCHLVTEQERIAYDVLKGYTPDPCDYIRQRGVEAFRDTVKENTQDGIIWAIMRNWDKNDLERQQQCYAIAARILSKVSLLKRDMYIRELSTKNRMGIGVKKILEEQVNLYLSEHFQKSSFTREQQDQITKYGIYVSNKQYYRPLNDGEGVPISNFFIRSMLLIDGNSSSERVIEMENNEGLKVIARIKSEVFTELGSFRAWSESRGNFFLDIEAKMWSNIRKLIYSQMTVAYPITILGHHRAGFYTFRNGIYDGEVFQPANDMGVVQAGSDHYIITASANFDNSKADDGNDKNINSTFLLYNNNGGHRYSFNEWGEMMRTCYGTKAIPGMSYFAASLFRDIIFERFTYFPHFNVFGVKGSGKNYFIESLMSCFGRVEPPVDLSSVTDKALPRIMGAMRNSLAWFDEYKNETQPEIISVLRGAYGASGRTTAEKSMDNNTRRFQPRSGLIISGEHRPTKDIALYSRCCAVETQSSVFTADQIRITEKLKELEQSGAMVEVTLYLLRYREYIHRNFYNKFRDIRNGLLDLTAGKSVESRILANWAVISTIGECLRDAGEKVPWELHEMLDIAVERIIYQSSIVTSEDHLANFWRIAAYLLEDNKVYHNHDIIVQAQKSVKIWGKSSRETIEYSTQDGENAKFIYLRLTKLHPLYMQYMQMQNRSNGMQIGTLEHYITTSKWYVGKCKKKFKDEAQICYVLRADNDFPVEFMYSKDVAEDSPF